MATTLNDIGVKFPNNSQQETAIQYNEFWVYSPNHWTVLNGGRCCAWTVPAGTTSIKFEVLSGGGPGGSSGGDNDFGVGGSGGNFTTKVLTKSAGQFVAGCVYTICAAGTSDCSCCCMCGVNCRHGCKSFVIGQGLSNFCAQGGTGGSTNWDMVSNCYNCFIGNVQCNVGQYNAGWINCYCNEATFGGDIEFRGTSGSMNAEYSCCADRFSVAGIPTGPFKSAHGVSGKHACTGGAACCSAHSVFPAGGGAGHNTASVSGCWGSFGAGGLVKITYS